MNKSFLYDLLIDPVTRGPLVFDSISDSLRDSKSVNKYPITESVPRILAEGKESEGKPDLHNKYDSVFNYADHYQKDAELFDYFRNNLPGTERNEINRLHESIVKEIFEEQSVILDVGCGNGWVSKKLIPLKKKVISMDISSVNPIRAVKEVKDENHAGLIADIYNIPLKENSVDCIVASEILEHVADPTLFISILVNLLKDNGKLIITTPYNEKIEYYLCVHCNRPTPRSGHLHSFNEENITGYIPKAGVSWHSKKLINKSLSRIRSHVILKYLPFSLWKPVDRLFNILLNNPSRLQVVIIKEK